MPRTRIDSRDDPDYWTALGRFIHRFATVEAVMFHFLAFYAGVSNPVAKAIFSGVRVEAGVDYVRRIIQVRDPGLERRTELENVFRQLKAINRLRNDIAHQGSFETDDAGRITSNIVRALTQDRIIERPASIAVLEAAALDLDKIGQHLVMQMVRPRATFDKRVAEMPVLADAWRYTSAQ